MTDLFFFLLYLDLIASILSEFNQRINRHIDFLFFCDDDDDVIQQLEIKINWLLADAIQ